MEDLLADKEDGVEQIIKYLETKFGVKQHPKIAKKLNDFYSCSRKTDEDLVKYVSRFERTYKERSERTESKVLLLSQTPLLPFYCSNPVISMT